MAEEGLKPLRPEQAAATAPGAHVWLSASAGTGKTFVLAGRVFRLLLQGVPPERILCLTFTKAGAAEMANRVHERLARWVRMDDTELFGDLEALGEPSGPEARAAARLLFARVLEATGGGLKILTIHSFCQSLLGAFPLEAGLVPGFRQLDERSQAELARETLARLVEERAAADPLLIPGLEALSLRLGEAGAEAYVLRCASRLGALRSLDVAIEPALRARLGLPEGEPDVIAAGLCADDAFDVQALRALAALNNQWGTKTGLAACDTIAAWLARTASARAETIGDVAAIVLTGAGEIRAAQAKLSADLAARIASACQSVTDMRHRLAYTRSAALGLHAARAFAEAYAAAKRVRGLVDFDDLIGWTVALLRLGGMAEWIRYKLDQGIDHILVDEAQDTNNAQWLIVDALVEEYFQIDPYAPERPRTLFVVGDDKQAIFGFQGTSPDAFREAKRRFEGLAIDAGQPFQALPLSESFRSVPAVLEMVDAVLGELGPEALGLAGPAPAHRSARPYPGRVELWRPTSLSGADGDDAVEADLAGEEDWAGDHVRAHAAAIAGQIRGWLDMPLMLEAKGRAITPGDIMILVRSRSDLARLIVARLHEEGVPVAGIDRLRLQAPLAVRDLLAALRFAVQPRDDLNLANLLVSPLIGWDQNRLMRAAIRPSGIDLWAHLRATQDETVLAPLRALLAAADFTTVHGMLEQILSGPMQGRRALLGRLGAEAADAIEELLNAALAFESESNPSLQHFIAWFDRGEREIKRDLGDAGDAVRVLTVHGAKGLQAPIVILADATFNPARQMRDASVDWGVDEGALLPVLMPRKAERFDALGEAVTKAERLAMQEHWRLLYVAMTRAEEILAIGGALGPRDRGQTHETSWHATIERAMAGLACAWADASHWGAARHWRGKTAHAAASPSPGTSEAEPAVLAVPSWLHEPAPPEARPPRPLSPSAPVEDEAPRTPPSPAQRSAARRGTMLHALLERLPGVAPDRRREAALAWLAMQPDAGDATAQTQLADEALTVLADPGFAALFGPDALAEAPIVATVGGRVIAGTVDRLLVENDRVLVVDFKTGLSVPGDAQAVPPSHLRQMTAYVAALEVIFPGRRIEAALLYTAGPRLISLRSDLVETVKPDFTGG